MSMVFLAIARFVERNARPILIVEVLLTAVFLAYIPDNFRFESDLNKFLPDNAETRAHDRVQSYFGHDPSSYFIHVVPRDGDNVLTPDALREQIMIDKAIERSDLSGGTVREIDGYVSFAKFVELYYRANITGTYSGPIEDLPDDALLELVDNVATFLQGNNYQNFVDVWAALQAVANSVSPEDRETLHRITPEDLMIIDDSILNRDLRQEYDQRYGRAVPKASSTLIVVYINGTLDPKVRKEVAKEVHDKVLGGLRLEHVELRETGADLLASEIDDLTYVSNAILGIGILIVILAVLYATFRSVSYMLLPVLTMVLAIVWTLGTIIVVGMAFPAYAIVFTAIDVAAIPLIVGLGVDDSVHLSKRYQEELRRCGRAGEAMTTSLHRIGTAIFLTSLTTALAFMSNLVSPVVPVRDFGIICALGISYAFLLTITFQAALRYELDRYSANVPECVERASLDIENGIRRTGRAVLDRPAPVIAAVLLVTLASIWGATTVRTDFRLEDFLPTEMEVVRTYSDIESSYNASSQSRVYLLIEGDVATKDNMEALADLEERVWDDGLLVHVEVENGPTEDIYRAYSVLSVVRLAIFENASLADRFHVDPDGRPRTDCTDADVRALLTYLHTDDRYRYTLRTVLHGVNRSGDWTFDAMVIRMFVDARSETSKARQVYNDLDDDRRGATFGEGIRVTKAGYVISTIRTIEAIQVSQVQSTILAIIVSALILMLIYRSVVVGILSAAPVAISAAWVLGTMALLEGLHANYWSGVPDISLNVLTVMVTALTIGLGIDYSIHIVQRFREERAHAEPRTAMLTSITHSGASIFISMITTVLGFVVLLFSPMPITQHFGLITSVTMIFAFLLCVFFMPIFLLRWSERAGTWSGGGTGPLPAIGRILGRRGEAGRTGAGGAEGDTATVPSITIEGVESTGEDEDVCIVIVEEE